MFGSVSIPCVCDTLHLDNTSSPITNIYSLIQLLGISVHALAENGVAESKDKPAILHDNQAGTATKSKIIVEKGGEFLTQPSEEHVEYHRYSTLVVLI